MKGLNAIPLGTLEVQEHESNSFFSGRVAPFHDGAEAVF